MMRRKILMISQHLLRCSHVHQSCPCSTSILTIPELRESSKHLVPAPHTQLQCSYRGYAEKRTKAKKDSKGKPVKPRVELNAEELNGLLDVNKYRTQLQHVVDELKNDYIHHLSLRTSTGVFDNIIVKTADGKFPLNQLAQIAKKSAQLVVINMAASPTYISAVREAITESGMNVNPQQDGTNLVIPIPKITKEHRDNLSKSAKTLMDKSKEKLRDVHNKYNKKVKSDKTRSQELVRNASELTLFILHEYTDQVEKRMKAKQTELLGS